MTLNDREIILVTYSTEYNWTDKLPDSNWLCILVDNDRPRNYINEVVSKLIEKDVVWVCTLGQSSEKVHDLIDEELAYREADIEALYLPEHDVMTTWHNNFDEGIWFGIYSANDESHKINKVVILDMTGGKESEKINKLLEGYEG